MPEAIAVSAATTAVPLRDDARVILERDPELTSERGKALKTLLYLFERDAVVKTALSG